MIFVILIVIVIFGGVKLDCSHDWQTLLSGSRTTAQILLDAGADPDRWTIYLAVKTFEIDDWE